MAPVSMYQVHEMIFLKGNFSIHNAAQTSKPTSKGKFSVENDSWSLSSCSITSCVSGCFHSNHPTSCLILYCSRAAGPHRNGLGGGEREEAEVWGGGGGGGGDRRGLSECSIP